MILAIDVAYHGDLARVAGLLFPTWDSEQAAHQIALDNIPAAEYMPGQFYRRELPCIAALLEQIEQTIDCIVIDGYVSLGANATPGLGMKLWEFMHGSTPIIGVAKTEFMGTPENAKIFRGGSARPLFISVVGMELEVAKAAVLSMKGKYRMPNLLKQVDSLARGHL